jgi:hypothetical protein
MENIKNYTNFIFEKKMIEKEGISPAVYKDLEDFFSGGGKHSFEEAQKFIMKKKKGWKLSKEDFEEAKKKFKN